MITQRIPHVYAVPGLYDVLYNRNRSYKLGEATAMACILENQVNRPKSILELFSGASSYHKQYLMDAYSHCDEIQVYRGLDAYATKSDDVVVAAPHAPFGSTYDAIISYFYTSSTVIDPNSDKGLVTRAYTTEVFRNLRNHLNEGGFFVLECSGNGGAGLGLRCAIDEEAVVDGKFAGYYRSEDRLWPRHPLMAYLHTVLKDALGTSAATSILTNPVDVVSYTRPVYDRATGNVMDYIHCYVEIYGDAILEFRIEQPFCQHYFEESELSCMLTEAGFSRLDYWNCDYNEHEFTHLSAQVDSDSRFKPEMTEAELDENVEELSANIIVAYV